MRGCLCLLAMVFGGLVLQGCSESVPAAEGAWGPAQNGVRAMLFSPRSVWTLGQEVEVRVRLRNAKGEFVDFQSSADLELTITRGDERVGEDRDYVTLAEKGIRLSPGEIIEFPLRSYPTGDPGGKLSKGSGGYRFAGRLAGLELPPLDIRVE